MADTQASMGKVRVKPPSLLACISCRRSHLKCDGTKPLCSRCADKNLECVWMESRRGYRDYRKGPSSNHDERRRRGSGYFTGLRPQNEPAPEAFVLDATLAAVHPYTYDELFNTSIIGIDVPTSYGAVAPNLQPPPAATTQMPSPSGSNNSSTTSVTRELPIVHGGVSSSSKREPTDLIDVYYKYFHGSHPFLIPQKLYKQRPDLLPDPVKAAVRFLAAHYVPNQNLTALQNATAVIFSDEVPDDVYKIQALMLYTCTCFARYEQIQGKVALDIAIEIALRIGLNKHAYAVTHAPDNAVIQESFRRTWWILFVFEGLITAIGGQNTPFRLHNVYCDVPLPGDENAYNSLKSSTSPRCLNDFRNRTFSEDNYAYSSFVFAIEAMYIMGAIFELGPDTFAITDNQVEAIDASISNFFLSLPPDMREVVPDPDGHLDETLRVTHMLINWAAILIHRPRSTLTFIRNHYSTICTRSEAAGLPALAYASHTSKTLRAANALVGLASIHRPLTYCTPVMMCAVTTAATVHLPAYAIAETPSQATVIKERLQLAISALGRFAEIWPRASIAKSQVAGFAREVLTQPSVCVDSTGPGLPNATPITVATEGNGILVGAPSSLPALEFAGESISADGAVSDPLDTSGSEGEDWMMDNLMQGQLADAVRQ